MLMLVSNRYPYFQILQILLTDAIVSCRRKALEDFVLADGSKIEKDNWVCIPQRAIMHDPQRYSSPEMFDGFRFARVNASLREGRRTQETPDKTLSNLTTTNVDWPIWGLGNTAW